MALTFLQRGQQHFVRTVNLMSCRCRNSSTYDTAETKEFLSKFGGGSVDLVRDDESGIANVLINHMQRKNAFSGAMMVQLSDVVDDLERWKGGRGVVLRGAGNMFCSGGDLTLMRSLLASSRGTDMSHFMQDTLTRFYQLPLLSIAFVEGKALGGGAEVAVACDFRAFGPDSSIGFVQSRLGLSPGWGGGLRVVELLGRRQALRLLASGEVCSRQEASRIGLADFSVANFDEVLEVADRLTSAINPTVQQAAKRVVVNASAPINYAGKLEGERCVFGSVWGGTGHVGAMGKSMKFTDDKKPSSNS